MPVTRLRPQRFATLSDPSTLSGLKVWLKPDDLNGSLADADPVASWTDAASSVAFAQATSGKRPTLRKNVRNGHSVVRFDGVDDVLTVATNVLQSVTSRTILLVWLSGATVAAAQVIFGQANIGFNVGMSAVGRLQAQYRNTAGTAVSPVSPIGTQFSTSQWTLGSYLTSTSGANVRSVLRNKTSTRLDSTLATGHQDPSNGTLCVGGLGTTPSSPAKGDLAELLAWNRALTDAERLSVERYLGLKFGLTVS